MMENYNLILYLSLRVQNFQINVVARLFLDAEMQMQANYKQLCLVSIVEMALHALLPSLSVHFHWFALKNAVQQPYSLRISKKNRSPTEEKFGLRLCQWATRPSGRFVQSRQLDASSSRAG